ncbi:MAG: winged helix-turn-helix transcriptional regulator [Bdellovibrionota bacterium]
MKKTSPPKVEYSLTKLGLEFKPILASIVDVGHKLKASQNKTVK